MTKKKVVKKKTKKKVKAKKKAVRKKNPLQKAPQFYTEETKKMLLHKKILAVQKAYPQIQCDAQGEDLDREAFGFVEASTVNAQYNEAMSKEGLTFVPIHKETTLGKNCVLVETTFLLSDSKTGYGIEIAGVGLGMNGQWAANSAQTLAKKQALLEAFQCSWPQPEDYRETVRKVSQREFGPADSPQQLNDALDEVLNRALKAKETKKKR